jgi:hypothetical protein
MSGRRKCDCEVVVFLKVGIFWKTWTGDALPVVLCQGFNAMRCDVRDISLVEINAVLVSDCGQELPGRRDQSIVHARRMFKSIQNPSLC